MGKLRLEELENNRYLDAKKDRKYNCIFCEDDKHHLYVSIKKKMYHCFKCGAAGTLIISDEGIGLTEKIYNWKTVTNLDLSVKDKPIRTLPRNIEVIYLSRSNYLRSRGLTVKDIRDLDVRESLDATGVYTNTIIFPIWSENDPENGDWESRQLEYFVCRTIEKDRNPKYINAPWEKGNTTYHLADYYTDGKVDKKHLNIHVICEGIFDAVACWKAGASRVDGLLGKKANTAQLEKLMRIADVDIVIALDYDAFSYAVKLKLELMAMGLEINRNRRVHIAQLPQGMDPDNVGPDRLRKIFQQCVSSRPR